MDFSTQVYPGSRVKIREVQLVARDILCEIDRICRRHNIPYQLFAGTLLGAVRHRGFIPWDDDADVALTRKDWHRFLAACKTSLGSAYFLQTCETDPEYTGQYAKIRKNGTVFREQQVASSNIHHGVFVDVFALDTVKPGAWIGVVQRWLLCWIRRVRLLGLCNARHPTRSPFKRVYRLFLRCVNIGMGKQRMDRMETRVSSWFLESDSPWISHLQNGATAKRYRQFLMHKDDFYKMEALSFEGRDFPVPANYDAVLKNIYGNYMEWPPEKDRCPQHPVVEVRLTGMDRDRGA